MMSVRTLEKQRLRQTLDTIRASIQVTGYPDYESLLEQRYSRWIEQGNVVLDVGAHRGRHLRRFIELLGTTGRVLAFEPLPFAFREISLLAAPNVELHNVALSDHQGTADFVFNEGAPEESGLEERIYNDPSLKKLTRLPCVLDTLDNYTDRLDRVDFVKIDIEGGEIDCLRGAAQTLRRFRPLISVEYGYPSYSVYKHTKHTLFDLSAKHDYVLYDLHLNLLADREDWDLACDSVYWDYFMVPAESQDLFRRKLGAAS